LFKFKIANELSEFRNYLIINWDEKGLRIQMEVWKINYFLICYYIFVNFIAFVLYGADKHKAVKHQWRIPEKVLLGIAFLGGCLGAFLGMKVFHHKTKHMLFQLLVPVAIVLHIIFMIMILSGRTI
ncbi:MAG: DUF1294 domain-containing protein, partial [Lachnospiraceae bacterium]